MRRVKVTVLLAPASIYVKAARMSEGYAPAEDARFAVVHAEGRPDGAWVVVHRRSGGLVGSLLPALSRKLTMTEMLSVCAAWHAATHLDWAPFDSLPQQEPGGSMVAFADPDAAQRTAAHMRELARQALGLSMAA